MKDMSDLDRVGSASWEWAREVNTREAGCEDGRGPARGIERVDVIVEIDGTLSGGRKS